MRLPVALLAALVVTLAGCGASTSPEAATDPRPAAPGIGSTSQPLIGTGKTADLDFGGTTLAGDAFDGSSLAGKPAVLWFWAPWCPTCRSQIPNMSALAEKYQGRVQVIAVGGLDSDEAITELAARIPGVTHLVDARGVVWRHFRVTAQSTFTVISADGEIMSEGYLEDGELDDLVARLAAEGA